MKYGWFQAKEVTVTSEKLIQITELVENILLQINYEIIAYLVMLFSLSLHKKTPLLLRWPFGELRGNSEETSIA